MFIYIDSTNPNPPQLLHQEATFLSFLLRRLPASSPRSLLSATSLLPASPHLPPDRGRRRQAIHPSPSPPLAVFFTPPARLPPPTTSTPSPNFPCRRHSNLAQQSPNQKGRGAIGAALLLSFLLLANVAALLLPPAQAPLTVKIRQPSHLFTFGVGMTFVSYPLVLTPVV
jgi:hypothetical protein